MQDLAPTITPAATPAAAPSPQSDPSTASPALVPSFLDGIDSLGGDPKPQEPAAPTPQATAKPPEAPKAPEPKTPEPKAQDDDDDLPKAPVSTPKPTEDPKGQTPDSEPTTPKGLREALKAAKADLAKFTAEKAEIQKQIDAAKRAGADEATASLKQELETLRQQQAKAEDTMRYFDYRNSKEYKEKYQEPLEKAWREALTDINGYTYEDENGQTQKVSADTLTQLVRMPTVQASQAASKIFGTAAPEIMAHRREILRLDRGAQEAEATWKAKGSELTQAQQRQQQERLENSVKLYHDHGKALRQTAPDLFERPTDPQEAAYYDKGLVLVQKALEGKGLPDGLTPEQRHSEVIKAQATVATRASAYGPLLHRFHGQKTRIEALEKELATFKNSTPRTDGGKTEPAPVTKKDSSFDEAFDNWARTVK